MGGLAAVGGAHLLFDYPPTQQSALLDAMFKPGAGAEFQILKTEILGDIDSSYGSGPSTEHERGQFDATQSPYLTWLIPEARKRNPNITLYALSWGVPSWIGNGSYFTPDNIAFHADYLAAAQKLGIEFDYLGIWNEMPWRRDYVKQLRQTLDARGLTRTKLVLGDGAMDAPCLDCPKEWGRSISSAVSHDADLRAAVFALGVHSSSPEGIAPLDPPLDNIPYWNSEQNLVDGPFPQSDPTPVNPYGAGLAWPRVVLANWVRAGATATVLCPLMHSWSWNLGRQNHGLAQLRTPWSGFFALGSAFKSMGHITKFVPVGWHFALAPGASGERKDDDLLWATFLSPSETDASAVFAYMGSSAPLQIDLHMFTRSPPARVAVWRSLANNNTWLQRTDDAHPDAQGHIHLTLAPRSIYTVTTLVDVQPVFWPQPPSPTRFPLPYRGGSAYPMLSSVFGSFVLNATTGRLEQRAIGNPGRNGWHGEINGLPVTTLPSGSNLAAVNLSLSLFPAADTREMRACIWMPVWRPFGFQSTNYSLGVCLSLQFAGDAGTDDNLISWTLYEGLPDSRTVLARGAVEKQQARVGAVVGHQVWVSGQDGRVRCALDGKELTSEEGVAAPTLLAGVCAFGCDYTRAAFADVLVDVPPGVAVTPNSFLLDMLPAGPVVGNWTAAGWGGAALQTAAGSAVRIAQLGRFKVGGNAAGKHQLALAQAGSGGSATVLATATVDVGACVADALGFCYASLDHIVNLAPSTRYYLLSAEQPHGDAFLQLTDPASATTHGHRDGSSILDYDASLAQVLGAVQCSGSASGEMHLHIGDGLEACAMSGEIDTMFGPLNMVLAA